MIDDTWFQRPEGVRESVAAGGIVARREGADILIALAQERILDDYVLPKGHVDPGETIEQAAAREIEEEVGISDLLLVGSLGTKERLSYDKTEWKISHYFLYTTDQIEATPTDRDQHDAMAWFPLKDLPKVFWPEQRELLMENRDRIVSTFA